MNITSEQFEPLFQYVDGDEGEVINEIRLQRFTDEKDIIARLRMLTTMTIADMLTCLQQFASPKGLHHFLNRLTLYQDTLMMKGVSPRDIKIGIIRDALFALMEDTPELAIYNDACGIICENGGEEGCLPQLRGRHSHVSDTGIGFAYQLLHDLYVAAACHCRYSDDEFVSDPVDVASEWLATTADYPIPGGRFQTMRSLREALSWAQVEDSVLRERLKDIRRQGESLQNLDRFSCDSQRTDLLHKAVILHDSFSSLYSPIDWINHAPFSSIARAYQSLQDGKVLDDIISREVVRVVLGTSQASEDAESIQSLFGKAKHGLSSVQRDLENMVKVGTILSESGCPYSFGDVSQIAETRFDGLSNAVNMFGLDTVKEHLRKGVSLRDAVDKRNQSVSLLPDDTVTSMSS